ncbi:MAG: DNA mismatch endonuclease Vsr [Burkholderiaceae bacterium]|nr:DNA mismatch endonuclease Vsr [Burkholderiaceae bacterium]MEB2350602.1 DNA mismatch endonuclease Vsr [Burkholderiaceae bacterium]
MADVVDRATRSRMMSGIRNRDTGPERLIRSALHRLGFRFRLHPADVPGRPDLILPRYSAALFVHGCFWHGHDCSLFRLPGTRRPFWRAKISRNVERDAEVARLLEQQGWRQLTIWECAFRGPDSIGIEETVRRTARWMTSRRARGEIRGRP